MKLLKTLPLTFTGELHQVELVNFSIDPAEITGILPKDITPRILSGRCYISMVNVCLKKMRALSLPFHFSYRHVGLRLLVDDTLLSDDPYKGIFFLRSFTNNKRIVPIANVLSNYRLEYADFNKSDNAFMLNTLDGHYIRYAVNPETIPVSNPEFLKTIGRLDRAYGVVGRKLLVTKISRTEWPIEPVCCSDFETDLFRTAKPEAVFRISKTIHYKWNAPVSVKHHGSRLSDHAV